MAIQRAPVLQIVLLPLAATAAWFLLANHRSAAPDLLGRYSPSYALLLGLCALNTLLMWRNAWRREPARSAFSVLRPGGRELLIVAGTAAVLVVAERLLGTRAYAPSDAAALVLLAAASWQILPRTAADSPRLLGPMTLLFLIVLTGALVRLHGVDFGLPHLYDPDEDWFVATAREMLVDREPNPRWFGHPGTTVIYFLAALYGAGHWIGRRFGAVPEDLRAFFNHYQSEIYLGGRLLSVACAVATILLVYAVAARLFRSRPIGLLAAALIAVSPLHVMYSRVIRTDIQATLLVLAVFWFLIDVVERGRWRSVCLAGLATGIAIATKYPAALIGCTALVAMGFAPGSLRRRLALGAGYLGAAVAGLFIASPYLFLDFQTAFEDLTIEAPSWVLSHAGAGFLADLGWYLGYPCALALSAGGILLAAGGAVLCLRERSPSRWLLLSFPLVFLPFLAALPLRVRHWILPLVPFLCMLAAYALYEGLRYVRRRAALELEVWPVFMVMAVTLPLAKADVLFNRQLELPDTRTLAADWILAHIPPGRTLVVEAWAPQLPADRYHFLLVDRNGQLVDRATDLANKRAGRMRPFEKTGWDATFVPHGHLGRLQDVTAVERSGAEYLILTDRTYASYVAEGRDCAPCVDALRTYDALIASSHRIYELGPAEGRRQGPRVAVYVLGPGD